MLASYVYYDYIRWSMNCLYRVIVNMDAYVVVNTRIHTYASWQSIDDLVMWRPSICRKTSSRVWRVTDTHALGAWVLVPYLWSMGRSVHRRMYTQHYRYKCKLYRHRHRTVDHPALHTYYLFIVNNLVHMLQSITVKQCNLRFVLAESFGSPLF